MERKIPQKSYTYASYSEETSISGVGADLGQGDWSYSGCSLLAPNLTYFCSGGGLEGVGYLVWCHESATQG